MYTHILVPVDGSPTSQRGLHEAIALAKVHQAKLLLLHVVDYYPLMIEASSAAQAFETLRDTVLQQGRTIVAQAQAAATEAGVAAQTALREVTAYRVAQSIVQECVDADCDLIVMGTHGRRGFSRLMLGSDAEAVLKASPVPVLLVRAEEPSD